MITTEIYNGQGLGNQLWCYVVTRVIALDKGYDFGIMHGEKFKCLDFMNLDFGKELIGGTGPEGGPPITLPDRITHYYREKEIYHPKTGADIRTHDINLINIQDNTKIDGYMQDEQYIAHHKEKIREWLAIKPELFVPEFSNDNVCVINFRGGEYVNINDVFLPQKYWNDAIAHMHTINPDFRFIVVTDDPKTAKIFFPSFEIFHKSIGDDYSIIQNAHYLILSNSSFGWFPAWLSVKLKYCIAPKYWSRYNTSDGYWGLGYALTSGWSYLDRAGKISTYETSLKELQDYKSNPTQNAFKYPPEKAKRTLAIWIRISNYKIRQLIKMVLKKGPLFTFYFRRESF